MIDPSNYRFGLPVAASTYANKIDLSLSILHWGMLSMFVAWGLFFAYCLIRFRKGRNPVANAPVNISVTSYDHQLHFGLTGCRRTVPHLQRLLAHLETALVDLERRNDSAPSCGIGVNKRITNRKAGPNSNDRRPGR